MDVRRKSDGRQTNQGRNNGNVVTYNAVTTMVLQFTTLRRYCCCYSSQLCDVVAVAIALLLLWHCSDGVATALERCCCYSTTTMALM